MKFINSVLSYSVSFIAEPIASTLSGMRAQVSLDSPRILSEKRNSTNFIIQYSTKVQGIALDKINGFLADLGYNSEKIIAIEDNLIEHCGSFGSLRDGAIGAILLKPQVIEEIKEDFTLEHKFNIAHELGHLVNDDSNLGNLETKIKSSSFRLHTYGISMFALLFLSPCSLFTAHLVSCTAAKVTGLLIERNQSYIMELRADIWAAQQSQELAQGGINFLKRIQSKTSEHNKNVLEKYKSQAKNADSMVEKVTLSTKILLVKFLLNINEKISINMTHPPGNTRIAAIRDTMKKLCNKL